MRASLGVAMLVLFSVTICAPADASGYGPVQVVTPDACDVGQLAADPTGVLRGFASCDDGRVLYLERQPGGGWAQSRSTYDGEVAAVADDGQNVFLLLVRQGQVGIARRTHGGRELPWRSLHATTAVTAGLTARAGRWWAVWSSYVAPGNSPPHLWQAGTLFGVTKDAAQITFGSTSDVSPQLAIGPRARLILTWARQSSGQSTTRIASTNDGRWLSRQLSTAGATSAIANLVADTEAATLLVGEAKGSASSFRVITLPASGGSRVLLHKDGTGGGVLGGTSQLPAVGYEIGSTSSNQHPTFVLMHLTAGRFVSESVTFPTTGNDPFSSQVLHQLLVSGGHTTLIVDEQRQSESDPQSAKNASRLLSRTR